jgi:hypothetical protein
MPSSKQRSTSRFETCMYNVKATTHDYMGGQIPLSLAGFPGSGNNSS